MDPNRQQDNGQQFFQPNPRGEPPQQPATPYNQPLNPPGVQPQFQPPQPQYAQPSYEPVGMGTPAPVVPQMPKKSHTKLIVIIVVVILLAAGGITAALLMHTGKKALTSSSGKTTSSSQKKSSAPTTGFVAANKKACDLLTLSDAQKILGAATTANSTNGTGDTTDTNEAMTTCGYSNGDPTATNVNITEGILETTGALTAAAEAQFQADLQNLKTQYPNGTIVSGIGDGAYYVPALASLDVVDGSYELSINAGTLNNGSLTSDLSLAKQIAQAAVAKLAR